MRNLVQTIDLSNFTELESYFDGSPHSWTGKQVDLTEADIFIVCDINACNLKSGEFHVTKSIEIEIYDVNHRIKKHYMSISRFNDRYKNGFAIGWTKDESKPRPQVNKIEVKSSQWV